MCKNYGRSVAHTEMQVIRTFTERKPKSSVAATSPAKQVSLPLTKAHAGRVSLHIQLFTSGSVWSASETLSVK
eukprot:COSAG02_NODE_66_length_42609_cov_95.996848_30_plen_73_part_00